MEDRLQGAPTNFLRSWPKSRGVSRGSCMPTSYFRIHPGRLAWNLQINHLEKKMTFQTSMIMFHFNLPGCKFNQKFQKSNCQLPPSTPRTPKIPQNISLTINIYHFLMSFVLCNGSNRWNMWNTFLNLSGLTLEYENAFLHQTCQYSKSSSASEK